MAGILPAMPGRLILTTPLPDVARALGLPVPGRADPPRRNIQPGQEIACVRRAGLAHMRWGIIPVGRVNARGRPVMETIINARSETVFDKSAFDGVGRCVIPADGWYEWTGKTRQKTAWLITAKDGGLLWFAGICDTWTAPGGLVVPQAAVVTCAPNADVVDYHHRMGVLLPQDAVAQWLDPDPGVAARVMVQPGAGLLQVEDAGDVDWSGA